jgi:hypothetical protein
LNISHCLDFFVSFRHLIWSQKRYRRTMPLTSPPGWRRSANFPRPQRATVQRQERLPAGSPTAWNFCGRRGASAGCSPKSRSEMLIANSGRVAQWIGHRPTDPGVLPGSLISLGAMHAPSEKNESKRVTVVGFAPTPSRAGAVSQSFRSHGQAAVMADASGKTVHENTTLGEETPKRRQHG